MPAGRQSDREPIESAGRFAHEAVAFDPDDDILYLTEDNFGFASGLYRYKPRRRGHGHGREHGGRDGLRDGGRLQMLAVAGRPNANLGASQVPGTRYRVRWVDIDDVLWFTSTQGGGPAETSVGPIADGFGNGSGQVWAYHPRSETLRMVYESPGPDTLDLPDNITIRGRRGTLVLCEDGTNDNYLRALTRRGEIFDLALNRVAGQFNDEFAGATFSPDGHTLYVNLQASRSMTFAIWGPCDRLGV